MLTDVRYAQTQLRRLNSIKPLTPAQRDCLSRANDALIRLEDAFIQPDPHQVIQTGTYAGMTPAEVLAQRDEFNRLVNR